MFGKTTRKPRRLGRLRRLAPARHQTYRHSLQHELLEDRRLLATLVDTVDDDVDPNDGMISLREALMDERSEGTINFAQALNGLTIELDMGNGELMITKPLTIDASSLMDGVTIDAQGNSRVFNINDETTDLVSVEIVGMTITGGSVDGNGGGISSTEDLTLTNSTVMENSAGDRGGGIFAVGDVTLTDSTVSGNSAGGAGGGIIAIGDVTLTESTVMSNSAGGHGGGIYGYSIVTLTESSTVSGNSAYFSGGGIAALGDVTLTDSTVSGNSAELGRGGGIIAIGDVTLTDSTVSGNSAGGHGGGISATYEPSTVTLTNSTLSGNLAGGAGGGIYASDVVAINYSTAFENTAASGGGGIGFTVPNPAEGISQQLTINHSIVARNTSDGTGPDFIAPSSPENLTVSYSLIGDNTDTTLTEAQTPDADGNLVGDPNNGGVIDPKLEPLADNGGPTMTHALQTDSPAIDAGVPDAVAGQNGIPEFDQRGTPFSRVVDGDGDGDGDGDARIDMGAYELFLPVTISGYKWNDLNGDGEWDDGELGLENWTILLDSDGTPGNEDDVSVTTTDAGFYEFTDLGPLMDGNVYHVYEEVQDGWTQTFGTDGYMVDATSGNSLAGPSGMAEDGNFGNFQNITISGYKWNDLNGDGEWDDGEEGLENWTILLDSDGTPGNEDDVSVTTTDAGFYEFTDLGPLMDGNVYHVYEEVQDGWTQTFGTDGYMVDATSGNSLAGPSGMAEDGNFGNFQNITISGYKWNDLNGDGEWDDGEEGLENWTILLDSDGTPGNEDDVSVTTTDAGFYEFTDLGPLMDGNVYHVYEEVQDGWTQTFGTDGYMVDATSGNSLAGPSGMAEDGNFGNFQNITISGYKWNDLNGDGEWDDGEEGLENWTILLDSDGTPGNEDDVSVTTTDAGFYEFTDLGPLMDGNVYHVYEEVQDGWTQTFGTDGYMVDATSGNSLAGPSGMAEDGNFGNFQNITISGYKWNDLNGDGEWDDGEEGLENWTILLDSDGTPGNEDDVSVTTTDAGFYEFTDLGPLMDGNVYHVYEEVQDGWTQTFGTDGYMVDATSGNSLAGPSGMAEDGNFGNFQNITISGYKWNDLNGDGEWDDGEEGLENWTILLDSDGTPGNEDDVSVTTTDAGFYEFTDLGPLMDGNVYHVYEEVQDGWTQTFGTDGYMVDATSGNSLAGPSGMAEDGNFGNFQNITISGYKWNDLNGDGEWDDGELGLENWTILLDSDGTPGNEDDVSVTTTDAGFYEFTDLGPLMDGNVYHVYEEVQDGWTQTFGTDGYMVDATSGNSLAGPSGMAEDGNFGNFQNITISGYKWNDLNGDGEWDDGEEGLENWTILLDSDGTPGNEDDVSVTTTDAGFYEFTDLGPLMDGNVYHVYEEVQDGWTQTFGTDGYMVDATSGNSLAGPSGMAEDGNFGNFQNITISGYKWNDLNGDGEWDDGEEGLENWTILLDSDGTPGNEDDVSVTTTDAGFYEFTDLGPLMDGNVYHVYEEVQDGWTQTFGTDGYMVDATSGNSLAGPSGMAEDGNFGNFQNITISGYKWNDLNGDGEWDDGEEGLENWTILLDSDGTPGNEDDVSVTTTDAGFYEFTDLGPLMDGNVYHVYEEVQDGWTQTFGTDGYMVDATSGNSLAGPSGMAEDGNFGNFQNITISGYKWNDLNGDGEWNDGEEGLENWTILLDSDRDGLPDEMVATGSNGRYEFTNLGPGSYRVTEQMPREWTNTYDGSTTIIAVSGVDHVASFETTELLNFGNFQNATISGYKWDDTDGDGIWDEEEPGLEGWTIELDSGDDGTVDQIATTNGDGFYEFTNLGPGSYAISEQQQTGWTNTYDGRTTVQPESGAARTGRFEMTEELNFGNFQNITISGYKWEDTDGDGVWDEGELGLEGWTIELDSGDDGTFDQMTTTDGDGFYKFTDLGPGSYAISERLQTGWTNTYDGSTTVEAESGVDPAGQFETTEPLNFGNLDGNVTGIKFEDIDKNAERDSDEPIIEGWQIRAYQDDGNRFLEQSEFDAGYVTAVLTDQITGRYTMNLEPGDYILVELLWSGWAQSAPIRPVLALNLDTGGVPLGLGGHAITVVAGEAHIDQDFGNYQCPVDQNCVGCCVVDPDPPETDFGDAPTSYGDASHTITVGGPILGSIGPDAEVGSQYTANADGDDINGTAPDDEDGVTVPGFVQNVAGNFVVSGTAGAVLDAWADLNGDGSFGAGEQIATNMVLTGNPQMISATFNSTGTTYARFRVSHADGDVTGPEGLAGNGEVEDYVVFVGAGAPSDFGDAPATYGDAEHVIGAVILGAIGPDSEGASQPTANANGDDTNGTTPDDEDGVTVPAFVRNVANNFVVTGTSNAFLDAWADLNGDGDFNDPGEQIATNFVLTGGADIVPATFTSVGTTYARFRVSAAAGDVTGPTGTGLNAAANGEVEDYVVNVVDGTTTMTMRRFLASFFGNSPGTSGRGTSGSGTSDSVTSDSVTSDSVTSDSVTSGTGIPTSDSVFAEESSSQPDSELPRTANEPVETPATVATAADTVANGSMSRRVLLASSISSPLVVSPVTSATEAPASSTVDSTPVNPLSGSPAGVPASGSVDAIMAEFGVTPSSPAATPGSQQQGVPDETSDQVSAPLITSPVPVTSSPDSVGRVVHVVRFRSYNSASSHREREAETPVIRPSEPQLVTNEAASPSEDALRSLGSARTRLRPSAWAAVGERSVQSNVPVDPDNAFEFNDDPLAGVDLAIAEEFSAE